MSRFLFVFYTSSEGMAINNRLNSFFEYFFLILLYFLKYILHSYLSKWRNKLKFERFKSTEMPFLQFFSTLILQGNVQGHTWHLMCLSKLTFHSHLTAAACHLKDKLLFHHIIISNRTSARGCSYDTSPSLVDLCPLVDVI